MAPDVIIFMAAVPQLNLKKKKDFSVYSINASSMWPDDPAFMIYSHAGFASTNSLFWEDNTQILFLSESTDRSY